MPKRVRKVGKKCVSSLQKLAGKNPISHFKMVKIGSMLQMADIDVFFRQNVFFKQLFAFGGVNGQKRLLG